MLFKEGLNQIQRNKEINKLIIEERIWIEDGWSYRCSINISGIETMHLEEE